jgi:hypothetical protein
MTIARRTLGNLSVSTALFANEMGWKSAAHRYGNASQMRHACGLPRRHHPPAKHKPEPLLRAKQIHNVFHLMKLIPGPEVFWQIVLHVPSIWQQVDANRKGTLSHSSQEVGKQGVGNGRMREGDNEQGHLRSRRCLS